MIVLLHIQMICLFAKRLRINKSEAIPTVLSILPVISICNCKMFIYSSDLSTSKYLYFLLILRECEQNSVS